ncbi:MAG TPA: hypothetical protein VNO21_08260 [Polyangiaceae bacterium]|nr:hypothetical protein [Polyangiaceae bacterium]
MKRRCSLRYLREAGTGPESQPLPTVREVLRRAPRTFRQWTVEHAGALR